MEQIILLRGAMAVAILWPFSDSPHAAEMVGWTGYQSAHPLTPEGTNRARGPEVLYKAV